MSAGKHGSSEITVTYDDSSGTPRVITNGVLTMSGVKIESVQQLTHALGDSWEESSPTGFRKVAPITLHGFLDDTATTGTHIVMRVVDADVDPNGSTRTMSVLFGNTGSGLTVAGETRLATYEVLAKNGNLSEFEAMAQPTGAWTWA